MKRGPFVSALTATAMTSGLPFREAGAASPRVRMEINEFSSHPDLVDAFRNGVKAMRGVTDPSDPRSWTYWHYSHRFPPGAPPPTPPGLRDVWNRCKHHMPYFAGWHRGYVYFFEQMLRAQSGNPNFTLPYWDYYKNNGKIPKIFADEKLPDGTKNWLYWPGRSTTAGDLSYAAYAPSVTKFPIYSSARRKDNCEGKIEDNPHDTVHDNVGGDMSDPATAPRDPIFYAHHCNIDRLWAAWEHAGGGRQMPAAGDAWWNVSWKYGVDPSWTLTLAHMAETESLGYSYSDVSLPTPPAVPLPSRPPLRAAAPLHVLSALDAAATSGFALGPASVSVTIPLSPAGNSKLRTFALTETPSRRAEVILEGVELSEAGRRGGYSYSVYLNLPPGGGSTQTPDAFYLGSLGSFSIRVEQEMHPGPVTIHFPLGRALREQLRSGRLRPDQLTISFVQTGSPPGATANTQFVRFAKLHIAGVPTP